MQPLYLFYGDTLPPSLIISEALLRRARSAEGGKQAVLLFALFRPQAPVGRPLLVSRVGPRHLERSHRGGVRGPGVLQRPSLLVDLPGVRPLERARAGRWTSRMARGRWGDRAGGGQAREHSTLRGPGAALGQRVEASEQGLSGEVERSHAPYVAPGERGTVTATALAKASALQRVSFL